jgi:hypothetical protein
MATTPAPKEALTLAQEIQRLDNELLEKRKKLQALQQSEIEKLVLGFTSEVEKSGFDKVIVKKMVIEKLTRKNKKRS